MVLTSPDFQFQDLQKINKKSYSSWVIVVRSQIKHMTAVIKIVSFRIFTLFYHFFLCVRQDKKRYFTFR